MSTETEDYGWSLLFPNVRTDLIRSVDEYRRQVERADWSGFEFGINTVHTRDGEYQVMLDLPSGAGSIPEFLLHWGLIQPVTGTSGGDAFVTLRIDPSGFPWGIQGTG